MGMTQERVINRMPSVTWNFLRANDAKIQWDEENTKALTTENITAGDTAEPVKLAINNEGGWSRKIVNIEAAEGQTVTVIENMNVAASSNMEVKTQIKGHKDSVIRLIQVQKTEEDSLLFVDVQCDLDERARFETVQVFPGKGDIYLNNQVELTGDESSYRSDIGYLGQKTQNIDINLVVNHWGKKTECEIQADGALKDSATKTFRGTIDLKHGGIDAVGDEKETVLMLGEDVRNITIPVILCAEEFVQGNHGATIGELDEETLFYFESRGISKDTAEKLMSRAAIERLARLTGDEDTEKAILDDLEEVL